MPIRELRGYAHSQCPERHGGRSLQRLDFRRRVAARFRSFPAPASVVHCRPLGCGIRATRRSPVDFQALFTLEHSPQAAVLPGDRPRHCGALAYSGFSGVYSYRELARTISVRASELPLAGELSKSLGDLRVTLSQAARPESILDFRPRQPQAC